ncbi:hypothetical protein AncyloWKF20_19200 [Ancylobacter sp. WKF20]|uniref:hypothetical protein n=1 Tax=Ancylobacter sp. WKF20 TaxID=3039801 RepID=UPI0024343913|nr:hypothetical protein [Ancylobacter sp. WKF20]WGD29854.1 hypothetical protein AncyloWKF20_19200 [Ancylobacter sp. WKF20]
MTTELAGFSAAYHGPVDRLLISGPGWSGIGTPDQWEERARLILREVRRVRKAAPPTGPAHFLDHLERQGL